MTDDRQHRPRVLVIDDEPAIRRLVTVLLEEEGYAPVAVPSAIEGLALIERDPPALVLLDLMMPEMDGREALRRLRAQPGGGDIPVIIMSAAISMARGMDDVQAILSKPFDLAELVMTVERVLEAGGQKRASRKLMSGR